MATVHTTARGTEPYDKVYCLGYQVHHEDWSPYPRINKLRQTFLDRGYDVDVERLRLVTESYQQHEHLPHHPHRAGSVPGAVQVTSPSSSLRSMPPLLSGEALAVRNVFDDDNDLS